MAIPRISLKWSSAIFFLSVLMSLTSAGLSVWIINGHKKAIRHQDENSRKAVVPSSPFIPDTTGSRCNLRLKSTRSADVPKDWEATVEKNLEAAEYNIHYQEKEGEYQSPNRAHNLRATYRPGQVSIVTRKDSQQKEKWKLKLRTHSIVFDGSESYYPSANATIQTRGDTIDFKHGNLFTEEYVNNSQGIRQNFIIRQAPKENTHELRIAMHVSGLTAMKVNRSEVHFALKTGEDNWENKITYKDLKAWDAGGKTLASGMEVLGQELSLIVDTRGAIFPITVDPISTTVSTLVESNQASAFFGIRLSSAGDVNGDGYSDVIIGASGYDNGQTDEGAAFIYHGSSSGLSTTVSTQLESNQASANFGSSVSSAGDVNGDGYNDVIVGAYTYDNGQTDEGAAFVYHGSASGITTTVQTQLESNQVSAAFGFSVAGIGDVNGDGYSDVIVGAYTYDNGQTDEGAAFVYHGSSSGITTTIQTQLEINQASADMGISVAGAGDVNGDGYSDVIVGADLYDNGQTDEGAVFVYHGSASGITTTIQTQLEVNQASASCGNWVSSAGDVNGDGYSDVIVGADLYDNGQTDEGAAFVFHGSASGITTTVQTQLESNQASAIMGNSVACAGDVNGDGYSDVIVGAYHYANGQALEGAAFVYLGSSTGISTTISTQLENNQASATFGRCVASAGDVNGDGYSDVIVGASNYTNGETNEGAAYIYLGSTSGLSTTIATQLESNQISAYMGISVASAGDVNGDGYSDVIVGVDDYDNGQTDEGAAFIYHGSATGLSTTASTKLESNQASAYMGYCVASAGDVNGDGYSDVIVGADQYDNGQSQEGAAFVYLGSASGITTTIQVQLESNQANAHFGLSVAGAGDVNGDGYSDVIVGAYLYDNGQTDEGAAFVYHGSSSGITNTIKTQLERNQASAQMGISVASAGDVNGDGYSDVMVAANLYDNGQTDEGAVFVYHGSASGISTTVATQLESNQINAQMGAWNGIACAGDVNGDGYSDVIIGAFLYDNGQTDEGAAFVYHGSSSGITTTIQTQLECNQASAKMGLAVSSAGDVNGDGYSDVIVGAYLYDNGQTDEGAAFVYHGSSSGITTTVQTQFESNQASAELGYSVAYAGDVNGDGYSDMIVGVPYYDNGQTDEGVALVYYGNKGAGKRDNLRLYNADLSTNISQSNISSATFGAGLYAKSFLGRGKGKLVWEVKQQGTAFSSGSNLTNSISYTSQQGSLTDLGIAGTELKNLVTKQGKENKIRARVAYNKVTAITGQVYGPWIYLPDYQAGKIGMSPTPLPIELISFEAEAATGKVKLKWITASEINNDYFTVEKSQNIKDWVWVTNVKGAGNSNTSLSYTTDDDDPYTDISYYRLKQVDYNGAFQYSHIAPVEFNISGSAAFNVYPTPSYGDFQISFTGKKNEEVLIIIRNILGQEYYVKGFILDNDVFVQSINLLGTLTSGIYIVIASSNDRVFAKRIMIM